MFNKKKKNQKKQQEENQEISEEKQQEISQAATTMAALLAKSSMKEEEKQVWLNLLPIMSDEQILQLQEILTTEQLGKIQYQELLKLKQDIIDINEKYNKKILSSQEETLSELDKIDQEIDQLEKENNN